MGLCFPRSSPAAFSATRPPIWLSASIMYPLRSTCSALALKVFIGSRRLSHAARGVSKNFAVIFIHSFLMTAAAVARRGPRRGKATLYERGHEKLQPPGHLALERGKILHELVVA